MCSLWYFFLSTEYSLVTRCSVYNREYTHNPHEFVAELEPRMSL